MPTAHLAAVRSGPSFSASVCSSVNAGNNKLTPWSCRVNAMSPACRKRHELRKCYHGYNYFCGLGTEWLPLITQELSFLVTVSCCPRVRLCRGRSPALAPRSPDSSSSSFSEGCVALDMFLPLSGLPFSHVGSQGVGPKDLLGLIGL